MKRIFFVLYLSLFLSSCEDDINSPKYSNNDILGCVDPAACNFDPLADINDGSCIYIFSNTGQCSAYDDCQLSLNGSWNKSTCLDSEGFPFSNWNNLEISCGYSHQDGNYTHKLLLDDECILLQEVDCVDQQEFDCDWSNSSQECRKDTACIFKEEEGCNNSLECLWDGSKCLDTYVCQNENGDDYEGWDGTKENCENAYVCINNLGDHWIDWDPSSETSITDCNNVYQYTEGECVYNQSDSEDSGGTEDGGTDDGGADDGDTDDSGADDSGADDGGNG